MTKYTNGFASLDSNLGIIDARRQLSLNTIMYPRRMPVTLTVGPIANNSAVDLVTSDSPDLGPSGESLVSSVNHRETSSFGNGHSLPGILLTLVS